MFIDVFLAPLIAIPMMAVQLLLIVAAAFVELLVHLLAWGIASGWLSARSRGTTRAAYAVSSLTAAYLVAALTSPIWAGDALMLSPLFSWPALLAVVVAMVAAMSVPAAADTLNTRMALARADGPDPEKAPAPEPNTTLTLLAAYALAIALVLGGLSAWQTGTERVSLKDRLKTQATDRLCAEAEARVSDETRQTGNRLLAIGERLVGRDLGNELPCAPDEAAE